MSWMAFARRAAWLGLCVVLAAGCDSGSSSNGTGGSGGSAGSGGGDGGSGGAIEPPGSCSGVVAAATNTCLTQVNGHWADCYADTGAPCEDDDGVIENRLGRLDQTIVASCGDGEFGSLTAEALSQRAQVACESEALSLASRSFGGPQGAVWATASAQDQACLQAAHDSATAFIEGIVAENNTCLDAASCNAETIDAAVASLRETAASEIDAACSDLSSLIAVDAESYLDAAKHQADCVVATTHTETPGTNLSCGPSLVTEALPRGEYMQVVLDEEVWGTRCGDGTDWAFQVRLAPEGEPVDNVIVGMQGGGVCVFEGDCRNIVENNPGLLEALSDQAPTSGIFSNDPETNPFANWTKVYLPYCNQDVFIGGGTVQEFSDFSIARYGAINVRAALQYVRNVIWQLKDAEDGDGYRPDQVTAMFGGWSAGGFGTLYNYHYVLDDLQWPATAAFPDAALSLDSMGAISVPTLGVLAIQGWLAEPFLPPYCFDNTCAVGPVLYEASEPRLKAVPNQQFLILSNQNDITQVNTTFFPDTPSWINAERQSVCDTRDLDGIHYYLTSSTDSIHVVSLSNELYAGSVDGEVMADWLYAGAVTDPDNVVDRMEEGNFVADIDGVNEFPCEVAP